MVYKEKVGIKQGVYNNKFIITYNNLLLIKNVGSRDDNFRLIKKFIQYFTYFKLSNK